MAKIQLEINSCTECPLATKGHSGGSWCSNSNKHDWYCRASKTGSDYRVIKSNVDIGDQVPIPDYCPLMKTRTLELKKR